MTYKAYVTYTTATGKCTYERDGFFDVEDATNWVSNRMANIMREWGKIDPHGLIVFAEVCDDDGEFSTDFSDCYDLRCGC